MEVSDRTESRDLRWLLALTAAVGTFLLAFVPGGAWLSGGTAADVLMSATLKQLLTVLLLFVVPSLWARLIWRTSPWVAAALAALAFGFAWFSCKGAADALYLAPLSILPGVGLYALQRLKLSNFRTVLYASFLTLAGMFVCVCLRDLLESGDAYVSCRALIDAYAQVLEQGGAMELSVAGVSLKELVGAYRMNPETVCMPFMLGAAMCAGLSNTLFSHLWNKRGGAELRPLPAFQQWRCERWYVVLAATLTISMMLLGMFGLAAAGALSSVAEVMWRMPCALGGLCAVRRASLKLKKGWIFWCACAALVVLPSIASMILMLLGMLSSLRKPQANENGEGNGER